MVIESIFSLRVKLFFACLLFTFFFITLTVILSGLFSNNMIWQAVYLPPHFQLSNMLLALAIAGALTALCGYSLIHYHFTRRINRIDAAITQLTCGKLDIDLKVTGSDELAALAARINHLANKLSNEQENMLLSVIESLVNALEAKDTYTYSHSSEVADIALTIGRALKLPDDQLFKINFAAILHDIGKIGIPGHVLNKPEKLTEEEFNIVKEHPAIGARILAGIPLLKDVAEIVLHHHARWDGNGYPSSLAGSSIPLGSRIIAVADTYQAMVSNRPYRESLPHQEAIEQIARCAGSQLDPVIVSVFLKLYKDKYNGLP
ncbi:hypothetical protein P22_2150 [Propionispora sp. 2/2-37]|uniref:HD domain-containing phosphohydrolase n=1 Tax=Propionispora sp. 2/2-37 TaxID=1677858 RepID=UPI0006C13909|nr:HD domain-containing phosphohydrolase [Propionispora sp. 2/2-37]CUH96062.1 hypothetical protein P22_2150 [Propionispora sp. 2/2-37]